MAELKEFLQTSPRSLPVIVLADVSGSMAADGKINALNTSLADMISTFGSIEDLRADIHVCVVSFGGKACIHTPLQAARHVKWIDLTCGGGTPMGAAMVLAADLIEDQKAIPIRAYRPAVVLVSDGIPTDDWKAGLQRFVAGGRAQTADRLALAIGGDADEGMLSEFVTVYCPKCGHMISASESCGNCGERLPERRAPRVFHAEDASRIKSFFRFVTMSVASRSRSINPNLVPPMGDPFALDNF